jgi:hypothetical protein
LQSAAVQFALDFRFNRTSSWADVSIRQSSGGRSTNETANDTFVPGAEDRQEL